MSNLPPNPDVLDQECIAFSHYLIKQKPGNYVLEKYREAYFNSDSIRAHETISFDQFLSRIALVDPAFTRLVDSYASIFFRSCSVRRKWTLLLAILESCSPTYQSFEFPDSSSTSLLLARMAGKTLGSFLTLGIAFLLFAPVHLGFAAYSKLFARSHSS